MHSCPSLLLGRTMVRKPSSLCLLDRVERRVGFLLAPCLRSIRWSAYTWVAFPIQVCNTRPNK